MNSILKVAILAGVTSAQIGGPAVYRDVELGKLILSSVDVDTPDQDLPPLSTPEDSLPYDLIENQFSFNPYAGQDVTQLIVDGVFNLVHVNMKKDTPYGEFCKFDFSAQETSPSEVPTFMDLVSRSTHCQDHIVSMPLSDMADAARANDESHDATMKPLQVGGFIFHQPKSGSSLLSNAVAATGNRVISESNALASILNCEKCQESVVSKSLVDAIYLLSRVSVHEGISLKRLYVKLISTKGLWTVEHAYPDANLVYVYRDAEVVLQKLMNCKACKRTCAFKQRRNPSHELEHYLWEHGIENTSELDDESMCAAGVAASTLAALDDPAMTGHMLSYNMLLSEEGMRAALEALGITNTSDLFKGQRRYLKEIQPTRANRARIEVFDAEEDAVEVTSAVKKASERFLGADLSKRGIRL